MVWKKEGDRIHLTNGKGTLLITEITNANIRKTRVKVIDAIKKEKVHNYYLHIAIAPTKNMDRLNGFWKKQLKLALTKLLLWFVIDQKEKS